MAHFKRLSQAINSFTIQDLGITHKSERHAENISTRDIDISGCTAYMDFVPREKKDALAA